MERRRILFQGSLAKDKSRQPEPAERPEWALEFCTLLGKSLINSGFDIVLTSGGSLDVLVGASAVEACAAMSVDPKDRIRTYVYPGQTSGLNPSGMVVQP